MTQAWPHSEISTTVRTDIPSKNRVEGRSSRALLARVLKTASALFPTLSARVLTRMFLTPRARHRALDLSCARRVSVRVGARTIDVGLWGKGPLVLLAHGWGGSGEQLRALRQAVVAAGFTAISFDAPGHGGTPGRTSSLPAFQAAIAAVAERLGPYHAIVGHSLGGTAAALYAQTLSELQHAPGLALVAPMPGFAFAMDHFTRALSLDAETRERVVCNIERQVGTARSLMELLPLQPRSRTLLVHDAADRSIPLTCTRELSHAWQGSGLIETNGLGHNRVLHDPQVVDQIVSFVQHLPQALGSVLERQLRALDEVWPD